MSDDCTCPRDDRYPNVMDSGCPVHGWPSIASDKISPTDQKRIEELERRVGELEERLRTGTLNDLLDAGTPIAGAETVAKAKEFLGLDTEGET